jgi:Mg2+ and Co2+ transporter CorA
MSQQAPMTTTSIVSYLQEILETIHVEINSLENMIIDDGRSAGGEPSTDFAQYAEEVHKIKEYSDKSTRTINSIQQNEINSKYVLSKLTDYGDLMKRVDRLSSALDELEYKVTSHLSLPVSVSLSPLTLSPLRCFLP